jgi:hypothetical protein
MFSRWEVSRLERGRHEKETKMVGVQIPKFMSEPVPRLQSFQWSMVIIGR